MVILDISRGTSVAVAIEAIEMIPLDADKTRLGKHNQCCDKFISSITHHFSFKNFINKIIFILFY